MSAVLPISHPLTLVAPIVDVQPAYMLLPVAMGELDAYSPEAVAFARSKLVETVKQLRETARYLDRRLKSSPSESDPR